MEWDLQIPIYSGFEHKNAWLSVQNFEQILSYEHLSSQSWIETVSTVFFLWWRERIPWAFIHFMLHNRAFWLEFIHWGNNIHIKLEKLSEVDKLFVIWDRKEDFLLLNHLLIIARQNIYDCRSKLNRPSLRLFISKVNYIYQIEL